MWCCESIRLAQEMIPCWTSVNVVISLVFVKHGFSCKISVSHNDVDEDLSLCMMPCPFVNRYPCFGGACCLHPRVLMDLLDPDGGRQQLQKVGNYLLFNVVSYPRRLEYFTDQLVTCVNFPWMTFYHVVRLHMV
jgi:hypothetical protein